MIEAQSGGRGDTPLVFVHGGSASWRMGKDFLDALPDRVRWWAVDLPGHGASPWTPGRYDLRGVGAALAEWAAGHLDRPAWWYGHSYGGQAALAAAGVRPDAFAGLVIGDAPLAPARMYRLLDRMSGTLRRWQGWCGRPEEELLRLLGAEDAGGGRTRAEVLGAAHPYLVGQAAALHRHDPAFIEALLTESQQVYGHLGQAGEWIAGVPGPVLLLRADPAVMSLSSADDEALVRAAARHPAVTTVSGVGHGLHQFAPAEVAATISALIP
ncbi:alpha/beta hydrolase [Actinomadura sp. NPDC047616]|uniref:alpha/beta fold hydrolase n=1 Tax=Actinomadura sp. NPDC047616 TaxID=3155914 RepID=UPI0033CA7920